MTNSRSLPRRAMALLHRLGTFDAPGPRLTPANAPYLFIIIEQVAKETSQPKPDEVYLVDDHTAFIAYRGGIMGFGRKRVMGVGLPVLKGLSPAELRSVIAQEFGRFASRNVTLSVPLAAASKRTRMSLSTPRA